MHIKERKGGRVKIVALTMGFIVLSAALLTGVIALYAENRQHKNTLENIYERSFYELTDASNSMEMGLSKMLVSYDDEQTALLAMEVYKSSSAALDAMTRLPVDRVEIAQAEKFFNQTADFCMSFNKSLTQKGTDTNAYREKIEDLYIAARAVNANVRDEVEQFQNNGYNYGKMLAMRFKRNRDSEIRTEDGTNTENKYTTIEYPELIYDGPFSESTSKRCYKALENLTEYTYNEALIVIQKALPFTVNSAKFEGESGGAAPSYLVALNTDKGEFNVSITKNGAKILALVSNRAVGAKTLTEDKAKAAAQGFAARLGYDVEPVWYNESDGIATINLAPIKNDVVYYTDLVKVKIAMDNGELMGIEANCFCLNNCDRTYNAEINEDKVREIITDKLTVNNIRLAVVPKGEKEVLAYEVSAEFKGLDYFIYVDAVTGKQVNIMRVVDNDQGKMTY